MDMDIDDDIIIALGGLVALEYSQKPFRKERKEWVCEYLQDRGRSGRFATAYEDLRRDPQKFKENFRMSTEQFDYLYNLIKPHLQPKRNTRPDDAILPKERLCMTLEFLASGDIQRHMASVYRVSKQAFGHILEETCVAIYNVLKTQYLKSFTTQDWTQIANRYHSRWNFPNVLGAIDGKHVALECPDNAASTFYNYKGFHSLVLMGVADADYRFIYADIGGYGSEGDSTIFRDCEFGKALMYNRLHIPTPTPVFGSNIPYYFLADDAFPLHPHILKPYKPPRTNMPLSREQLIFNYRLSRARRCVENCFGILCARWICLARTMFMNPDRAQKVVAACCALHHFMMHEEKETYSPHGFGDYYRDDGTLVEGSWRRKITPNSLFNSNVSQQNQGRPKKDAVEIRDHLKNYFNSVEGSLPWQERLFR